MKAEREMKPMDKLTQQLKEDAAHIDVVVSDELDRRLTASLASVKPARDTRDGPRFPGARFWWASSLTGVAAALALIAFLNTGSRPDVPPVTETSPVSVAVTPIIEWKTESAMVTRPLQEELENLRSDIKKAEAAVKREIGL